MRVLLTLLAALSLSACAAIDKGPTNLSGQWGGPHVSLLLEGGLGTLEYDCASGTVDTVIYPAPDGSFSASGTHRTGQGGPIRAGQIFISQPVKYSGTVDKNHMTLSARLEDGTVIGPFSLVQGSSGELMRCL